MNCLAKTRKVHFWRKTTEQKYTKRIANENSVALEFNALTIIAKSDIQTSYFMA